MAGEKIPPYFIHVSDENLIPKAIAYLRSRNEKGYSGTGVTAGGEIPVDIEQTPKQRAKLLLGELSAGSDSKEVKLELKKLFPILIKSGEISADQASAIVRRYQL